MLSSNLIARMRADSLWQVNYSMTLERRPNACCAARLANIHGREICAKKHEQAGGDLDDVASASVSFGKMSPAKAIPNALATARLGSQRVRGFAD